MILWLPLTPLIARNPWHWLPQSIGSFKGVLTTFWWTKNRNIIANQLRKPRAQHLQESLETAAILKAPRKLLQCPAGYLCPQLDLMTSSSASTERETRGVPRVDSAGRNKKKKIQERGINKRKTKRVVKSKGVEGTLWAAAVWSPSPGRHILNPGQFPWQPDCMDCGQSLSKSRPLKSIKLNGFGRRRTMATIDVP